MLSEQRPEGRRRRLRPEGIGRLIVPGPGPSLQEGVLRQELVGVLLLASGGSCSVMEVSTFHVLSVHILNSACALWSRIPAACAVPCPLCMRCSVCLRCRSSSPLRSSASFRTWASGVEGWLWSCFRCCDVELAPSPPLRHHALPLSH